MTPPKKGTREYVMANPSFGIDFVQTKTYYTDINGSRQVQIGYMKQPNMGYDILTDDVLGTGDPKVLKDFRDKNAAALNQPNNAPAKGYLDARIQVADKVEQLGEKAKANAALGKKPKKHEVVATEDGFIGMPDLKYDNFQTSANGCWSCAYSLLLKSRGVNLSQEEIRCWRPSVDPNAPQDQKLSGERMRTMNSDKANSIFANSDLTAKLLPNTATNQLHMDSYNPSFVFCNGAPLNAEQRKLYYAEYKRQAVEKLSEQITQAITEHQSPVAIQWGGHYVTVTGIGGGVMFGTASTRYPKKLQEIGDPIYARDALNPHKTLFNELEEDLHLMGQDGPNHPELNSKLEHNEEYDVPNAVGKMKELSAFLMQKQTDGENKGKTYLEILNENHVKFGKSGKDFMDRLTKLGEVLDIPINGQELSKQAEEDRIRDGRPVPQMTQEYMDYSKLRQSYIDAAQESYRSADRDKPDTRNARYFCLAGIVATDTLWQQKIANGEERPKIEEKEVNAIASRIVQEPAFLNLLGPREGMVYQFYLKEGELVRQVANHNKSIQEEKQRKQAAVRSIHDAEKPAARDVQTATETMPRDKMEAYCKKVNEKRGVQPGHKDYVAPESFLDENTTPEALLDDTRKRIEAGEGTQRDYALLAATWQLASAEGGAAKNRPMTEADRQTLIQTTERFMANPLIVDMIENAPQEELLANGGKSLLGSFRSLNVMQDQQKNIRLQGKGKGDQQPETAPSEPGLS